MFRRLLRLSKAHNILHWIGGVILADVLECIELECTELEYTELEYTEFDSVGLKPVVAVDTIVPVEVIRPASVDWGTFGG